MATQAAPDAAIDIGRVIQRGFATIGRQGVAFLGLAAVLVGIPTFLTQYLLLSSGSSSDPAAAMSMMTSPVYWLGVLITVIAGFLLQAAIVRASIEDLQGQPVQMVPNLVEALKLLLPMIGLAILSSIAIGIGLVLLIIPGIIIYLMLIVAVPTLVEERKGVIGSMQRSAELTKGSRLRILLLLIIFFVAYIVFSMVVGLFGLVAMSSPVLFGLIQAVLGTVVGLLAAAMIASLYVELRTVKEGATTESLGAIFA